MVRRVILSLLFLFGMLGLRAQQMYMRVEVMKPAEVKVAANVRSLLLLNNTPLTNEIPQHCLFAAAGAFEDLERFDEVAVLPSLSPSASVDSLCNRYEADALLSLNALVFSDIQANGYWTIHYPGGRSYSFFSYTDSLFCEYDYECAEIVGEQLAYLLSPHWETEDRYFYSNNDEHIAAGLQAVSKRDWGAAIVEWNKALGGKNETEAYAAANIAVAYEMQDQYATALEWTRRAITYFRRINTADAAQQVVNLRYYESQLQERLANK